MGERVPKQKRGTSFKGVDRSLELIVDRLIVSEYLGYKKEDFRRTIEPSTVPVSRSD